jgi:hypothetical protein
VRFPLSEQLDLPCRFAEYAPGRLHPDGRRYLPLILLELDAQLWSGAAPLLGVVDRHHRVAPGDAGQRGSARIVMLLSTIRLQQPPFRQGLEAEASAAGRPSTAPTAYGQVVAVPTWETEREHLPYDTLYTELLIDIGGATLGVRTSATAADIGALIGSGRIAAGDYIAVTRSRIDILAFVQAD